LCSSSKYLAKSLSLWRPRSSRLQTTGNLVQTPWPKSPSELYRPSDRRLSAKLVSCSWHKSFRGEYRNRETQAALLERPQGWEDFRYAYTVRIRWK
jgi:hypothetical protein